MVAHISYVFNEVRRGVEGDSGVRVPEVALVIDSAAVA